MHTNRRSSPPPSQTGWSSICRATLSNESAKALPKPRIIIIIMRKLNLRACVLTRAMFVPHATQIIIMHFASSCEEHLQLFLRSFLLAENPSEWRSESQLNTVEPLLADTLNSKHLPHKDNALCTNCVSHIYCIYFKNQRTPGIVDTSE